MLVKMLAVELKISRWKVNSKRYLYSAIVSQNTSKTAENAKEVVTAQTIVYSLLITTSCGVWQVLMGLVRSGVDGRCRAAKIPNQSTWLLHIQCKSSCSNIR